jgi:UDP-glucose 4-epimerase
MMRVLVTGGAGTIGSAVVRRLLRDPSFEVRVADHRPAPDWMAQGCQVFEGDLRQLEVAQRALDGCSHVIHLAAIVGGIANFHKLPFTLTEVNNALTGAIVHAAIDQDVERFTYVSSSMVFENATEYPTTEDHVRVCPAPWSAYGPGELPDRDEPGIAHAVPDLIAKVLSGQRPLEIFGSGEQTRTLTHVSDIADGVVTAMASPAGENEDFNISASEELTVAEIARRIWVACGEDPERFELKHLPTFEVDVRRRWPSVRKAEELLGWSAQVALDDGLADTVSWLREVKVQAA